MKRVLLCEIFHESNTFNPVIEGLDRFILNQEYEGKAAYDRIITTPVLAHGMIDAIEEAGAEVIPTIFLRGGSGGRVQDSVFELFKERVKYYIEKAGQIDAVCLSLHGATCTESEDDMCGALLKYVRGLVGNIPVAAGFDLHANITKDMLQYGDIICGYQTYPHVDFYETGYRAAKLCMQMLEGKTIAQESYSVPMLVPPAGFTSSEEPLKEVLDAGHALVADGALLDFTVFVVQPWLDIKEISSTVIAIGEDPEVAKMHAKRLAEMLYRRRDEYMPDLMSVDEIIDIAEANTTCKPIVLSDASDSPNGGAVGDSPVVAMRLAERGSKLRAGMFVVDPDAVKKAFEVGVGNTTEFSIGAGFTPGMPGPFRAEGKVRSLHDGYFVVEGPAQRGVESSLGFCAVINFGNIDILVTETCKHSGDPQVFRHFGIEPTLYDLIVVKANTSFRRPYSAFAGRICSADTPGPCASNLKRFEWKNIPDGMYPFVD